MTINILKEIGGTLGCTHVLLGNPVLSYDVPFVTVAFEVAPWASDYKRFLHAGWEVYGHMGKTTIRLSCGDETFVDVTFKRIDVAADVPVLI